MKVLIIEDEQLSAEHLILMLRKIDPAIQITGRFETVKQSIRAFQEGIEADLVFLDIHLADGNSFDIFKHITLETPVIFTTAFDQYALQAFQLNSIDYLLKPIHIDDLRTALNKFNKLNRQQHKELIRNLMNLSSEGISRPPANACKNRFMVKIGETIVSIKTEEIHHFIAEDGLVFLAHFSGKRYPVDYTLDQLEPLLNPVQFFRINRKIILHFEAVKKVGTYFNSRLIVHCSHIEGDNAVVSRDRVSDFKSWLNG